MLIRLDAGMNLYCRIITTPKNHYYLESWNSEILNLLAVTIMADSTVVVPGQDLGAAKSLIPGAGTHTNATRIYASILGRVQQIQPPKAPGPQKRPTKITPQAPTLLPTISVVASTSIPIEGSPVGAQVKQKVIPEVGSVVLCKVTRITPRQASVAILVAGECVLDGEWQGLIRVQDVRATEKDRVKIYESFRPGDVVRAVVVCRIYTLAHLSHDTWRRQELY